MRADARAQKPADNRRAPRPSLAIATLGVLAALGPLQSLNAQRADRPHISVAPAIAAPPGSQIPFAIQIGPPEALPSQSFVRLRGLPPTVSLTEGYAIGPGSWAIPLFSLPRLRVNIPTSISGRGEIVISLVAIDGTLIAEATTALVIGPSAMLPPAEKPPAEPTQKQLSFVVAPPLPGGPDRNKQAGPRPTVLPPQEKARADRLLARGEEYLSSGNIAGARDFFERAADAGLAPAALRLAATYDPVELQRFQAQGIIPDRALARKWYERARELGALEAVERLARLGGS